MLIQILKLIEINEFIDNVYNYLTKVSNLIKIVIIIGIIYNN
jgi:hypothetical protein